MITPEIIERSKKVDPAQIGHYIESGYMHPRIKPLDETFRVLGPAFTVRLPGNDNSMLYYSMQKAPKGSVVVIDRMGEHRLACVGEIAALAARSRGMAGIVVDGPTTDTLPIKAMGFPVFSTGRSAVTTNLIGIDGEYDVVINCGGAVVRPGDIVFGDCDGVIVCPPDRFEEYLKKAEQANLSEAKYRETFAKGGYITDFIDIDKLAEMDGKAILRSMANK